MRVGFNPNKDKVLAKSDYIHQVLVPVYIPHQNDYFRESFQILQFCLESLFKTSHAKTYVTIVNNGSCIEVVAYLNQLQQDGKLQEVIHTTAIGKLNAILKGLAGHQFSLITITDADVLFLNDWQKATYEVFEAFPQTGVVSPVPNSKLCKYLTSNIIFDNLFNKKIKFSNVSSASDMLEFAKSVNNIEMFNEINLNKCLVIQNDDFKALLGAGHFVATYRGDIFNHFKSNYTKFALGTGEGIYLDKPVVEYGLWRLSTYDNFAFHMGNTAENWMKTRINSLTKNEEIHQEIEFPYIKKEKGLTKIKTIIFEKFIFNKRIWVIYLRNRGLTKEEIIKF